MVLDTRCFGAVALVARALVALPAMEVRRISAAAVGPVVLEATMRALAARQKWEATVGQGQFLALVSRAARPAVAEAVPMAAPQAQARGASAAYG